MRKTLIAVAAAAPVASAAIIGASPAQAWCFWGCDAGVGAPAAGPPPGAPTRTRHAAAPIGRANRYSMRTDCWSATRDRNICARSGTEAAPA
jgi:hypothetical protein